MCQCNKSHAKFNYKLFTESTGTLLIERRFCFFPTVSHVGWHVGALLRKILPAGALALHNMIDGRYTGPRCLSSVNTHYSTRLPTHHIAPGPEGGSTQQPRHQVGREGVRDLLSVPIGLFSHRELSNVHQGSGVECLLSWAQTEEESEKETRKKRVFEVWTSSISSAPLPLWSTGFIRLELTTANDKGGIEAA